ncbi:hypothetical protein GGR34_003296 [Microvirga flocculans]|uniref:Uncharacterized protein n=1 Tax=Microvirga flocculans TaxID=217168 RepID=A0A7W6IHM1_9HYPH|nr:hypothetical protein [Microvirga flocculans]MBB4041618.1 hypothetical protein [Microvirga flocculans]
MHPSLPDHLPYGGTDKYREHIAEMLSLVSVEAELGQTYCGMQDDAGLDYSIRKIIAYIRAAHESLRDLKAMKVDQARREQSPSRLAAE